MTYRRAHSGRFNVDRWLMLIFRPHCFAYLAASDAARRIIIFLWQKLPCSYNDASTSRAHVSSEFRRLVQSAYERPERTDGRKTRPDIFHPVYRVGILFTTSLFARVSGGIVISGRLIRPVGGRNKRTKRSRKHIHFRGRKKEWRAGVAEHGLRKRGSPGREGREKDKKGAKGEKLAQPSTSRAR